ncbi:MAG TPA: choice-of-anchor Q domain-containing protein [Polyangiaceae bacterium]
MTIEIPAGVYILEHCGSDETNDAGDLDILTSLPVALTAVGGTATIQQTCAGERVLDDRGQGKLTIAGVILTGGSLTGSDPSEPVSGGGLRAIGDVTLDKAIITGNSATGAPGLGDVAGGTAVNGGPCRGGGLYVGGSLIVRDSQIRSNRVTGGLGADAPAAGGLSSAGGSADGGGAYVVGSLRISSATIDANMAIGGNGGSGDISPSPGGSARGGGLAQEATSTARSTMDSIQLTSNVAWGGTSGTGRGVAFSPNIAGRADAMGGGLAAGGPTEIRGVKANDNKAFGGSSVGCAGCYGSVGQGGAIDASSTLKVTDSTLSNNTARGGTRTVCTTTTIPVPPPGSPGTPSDTCLGGGAPNPIPPPPENDPSYNPVTGYCRPYFCGSGCPLFCFYPPGYPICPPIQQTSCGQDSYVSSRGGGVWAVGDVELSNTDVLQNTAPGDGSAITTQAKLTIRRGDYSGNQPRAISAHEADIANANIHDNSLEGSNTVLIDGHLELRDSSYRHNGNGIGADSLSATNVTISGNGFPSPYTNFGQPLLMLHSADVTSRLVNTTIFDNPLFGRIVANNLYVDQSTIWSTNEWVPVFEVGRLTIHRSVVWKTNQGICLTDTSVESSSYNWFKDATCGLDGPGDQQGVGNVGLALLADNGGPVQTLLPQPGSDLIDKIPSDQCPVPSDARAVKRPQGAACDIGAVEVQQ